jgi:fibronectin-binding autotransporter adhesin
MDSYAIISGRPNSVGNHGHMACPPEICILIDFRNTHNFKRLLQCLKFLSIFAILLLSSQILSAAARTASVTGNWNDTNTWGGVSVPTLADAVTINDGITVTVDVATAECASLNTLNTGGITISGSNSLSVAGLLSMARPSANNTNFTITVGAGSLTVGSLTMSATTTTRNNIITISSGTLTILGTATTGTTGCQLTLTGAGTIDFRGIFASTPTITTFAGSTIKYSYAGVQTVTGTTYSNLEISGNGIKTLGANTTVTGALTVRAGSTLAIATRTLGSPTSTILECGAPSGSTITNTTGLFTLGGNVTVNSLGTGASGATLATLVALTNATTRTFSVADDGTAAIDLTISKIISTTGSLVKTGDGILLVSGANSYTGATTVNGGTLRAGIITNAFGTTSAVTLANTAGVTLDLNGFNNTIGSLTGGSATGGNITLGAGTLTCNSGVTTTYAGIISGTGGVTKSGTGTLILSGDNSYSGVTTVAAGTLSLGAAGGATNTPLGTVAGITSVTAGAALNLNGFTLGTAEPLTINGTGIAAAGALTNSSASAVTYSGLLTLGSAASIVASTGAINLTNTGTITGATFGLTLGGTVGGTLASIIGTTTGTVTKASTGTWTLSGSSTYTGATTISAGTLKLGAAGTDPNSPLGTIGGITSVTSGAVLDLNGFTLATAEPLTLNGTGITAGGALTNNSVTAVTYSGAITFASAASIVGAAGAIAITGTPVSSAIAITLGGAAGGSFTSVIAGARTVTKAGAGTWTLSGNSSYTGATTISAGTLKLGATGTAPNSPLGTIAGNTSVTSGATLDLNGFTLATAEPLSINGTGITSGGALSNSVATAVTYSGPITFATAASIIGEAGTIAITGTPVSSTIAITLGGTSGGSISTVIAGARTLTKIGAGTWTLSGASTYSGATAVNAGTLRAGRITNAFGTASAVTLANTAGVTLDLNGFSNTIGSLTGGGTTGGNVTLGTGTLTIGSNNSSPAAYAGIISGTGGVTKSGTGTLILSGDNSYSGVTTVAAGRLSLGAAGGTTNTPLGTTAGGTSVTSGATLNLNGFTLGTAESLTLNGTGIAAAGALSNTSASAVTYSGLLSLGSAASILASTGAINLTNTGTITGATFGLTLRGTIGGTLASIIGTTTGTLTKADSGTWTLSGSSTYTGITTISAGTLKLGASGTAPNSPLGTVAGSTLVSNGAALDLNGFTLATAEPLTLNGTGIAAGGALTNSSVTAVTYSGAITFVSAASIVGAAGTIAITGTPVSSNIAITLGGAAGGSFTSAIAGARTVTKAGAGTWTLSGNSSYTGATTISQGTLKLGATGTAPNSPLGTIGANTSVTSGATLDLNGFTLATAEPLSLNGTGISTGGALSNSVATAVTYSGAITFATAASIIGEAGTIAITGTPVSSAIAITLGGASGGSVSTVIAGARTLTKIGAGTWTLSGANTYTGATTISAGELRYNPGANITPASQIILDGGTLATTSITTGRTITNSSTLQLNAVSTINLGANVHTYTFANSSAITWNGASLTINGWTGTAGASGTAGKLFFGATTGTLTGGQLAKISFTGYPATPTLLASGELVPGVPPPADLSISGTLSHGSACIGSAASTITYTISNPSLLVANGVTVVSDNTQFVVSNAPTTIAAGGSATYDVTFTPSGSGLQTAIVTAASTTPGINSGTSNISGTGDPLSVGGTASIGLALLCPGGTTTVSLTGETGTIQWEQSPNGSSGWANVSGGSGATTASYTTPALYALTYYRANVTSGACASAVSNTVSTDIGNSWTGAVGTDWNVAGNWACGIPDLTTNVAIPNVANKPILNGGATGTVNNLTIAASSSLTVTGNTLQIAGTISSSGTFDAAAGTIEMKGTVSQTIPAGLFSGNNVMNLIVSNTAGAVLGGALNVTGMVLANTGNLASGGFLKLVSSAAQTALIDGSGGGSVTGNVIMQRYIPSAYGYKYISSPFSNATVAQYTSYFSPTVSISKLFSYNQNHQYSGSDLTGWVDHSTVTNSLNPGEGYALNFGVSGSATTMEITGQVNDNIGSLTLFNHNGTYTQGFNLVGNPYPSPIDWDATVALNTDIDDAIHFFEASGDEYSGAYTSYVNGVPGGVGLNIIPSMQGFFVHVTDGSFPVTGTLSLPNSVRTNDLNPGFKTAAIDPRTILHFSLKYDGENKKADPFVLYFDPIATPGFDKKADALKMMNTDVGLPNLYAITPDKRQLSISGIPIPRDSIVNTYLGINTLADGWVTFAATDLTRLPSNLNLFLVDGERKLIQDLKLMPSYRLYLKKGVSNNRLQLKITTADFPLPIFEEHQLFRLSRTGGAVVLVANLDQQETGMLTVSNISGQKLLVTEVMANQMVEIGSLVRSGVLLVQMKSGQRIQTEKTVVVNEN